MLARPAAAISITSFSPTSGTVGTSVTINGTGFSTTLANNTIKFNGTVATSLTATSIKLTTTVPSGASTGPITVTVGGSTATSSTSFTVKPQILSFSPGSGGVGATVIIHGQGFSPTAANDVVTFHGTTAVVTAATSQQLTTTVPVGATTGTIKVTVGSFSSTSTSSFTVTPSITDFEPIMGPGGTNVTIHGYNFSTNRASDIVKFNGTQVEVGTASATELDVFLPYDIPTGAGSITVTVGSNSGTSIDAFTVTPPPTIDWFSPTSGGVGTPVTIHGTGFNPDYTYDGVRFDSTWATVVAATETDMTALVPAGASSGPIQVVVGGGSATSVDSFTTLLSMTFGPLSAPVGATITVNGSNFSTTPSENILTFDNPYFHQLRASVTSASTNQLTFTVPPGAAGKISLTVGGETSTSDDTFVLAPDPLTISDRFTPDGAAVGTLVTVQGTGFSSMPSENSVEFNGTATAPLLASPTQLVVAVPPGASSGPISVSTGGNSATTVSSFDVFATGQFLLPTPHSALSVPGGEFGYGVAVDGDTAVIGAPGVPSSSGVQSGVVYVFHRDNETNWNLQDTLSAADASTDDLFGSAVAVQDQTIAVGAPGSSGHQGSVYVFEKSGSEWSQSEKLTAANGMPSDDFGQSVSVDAGTLLIGAPHISSPFTGGGSAYVFTFDGSTWAQEAELVGSDTAAGDLLGHSVSVSGDSALVGAPNAQGAAGAAYAFVRNGIAWSQQDELEQPSGGTDQFFGFSVALDGNSALVGAPANVNEAGSAFLFARTGSTWSLDTQLQSTNLAPAPGDSFGVSVALQGTNIAIGAAGVYYSFDYSSQNGWQLDYYSPDYTSSLDQYGSSIAMSASTIVVGAPLGSTLQGFGAGFAEIHTNYFPDAVLPAEATVTCANGCDMYGNSVAASGDTALVGDLLDRTNLDYATGSVYVFTHAGGTWSQQAKLTPINDSQQNEFGASVALDEDTAVIGAPYDGGTTSASPGAAYVFVRTGTMWSQQARVTPNDWAALGITAGTSVAINADTMILGAPNGWGVEGSTASGAAYIFTRNGNEWTFQSKASSSDTTPNVRFGTSVAINGDIAVFGAPDAGVSHHGAYVFTRSGHVWTQQTKLSPQQANFSDDFGTTVAIVNGTILVGSPTTRATSVSSPIGEVYVFDYDGSAWTQTNVLTNAATDNFGGSLAATSDLAVVGSSNGSDELVYPYACSKASRETYEGPFNVPDQGAPADLAVSGTTILKSGSLGKVYAFNVSPISTSTSISGVAPSPAALGGSYTVSVALSTPIGCTQLEGTVLVSDDLGNSCSIDPSAETSCSLPASHDGVRSLSANFVPANATLLQGSIGTGSATVSTPDSSAQVSIVGVSPEPSVVGHSYQTQVAVTPVPPATAAPTGTVTVSDGGTTCSFVLPQTSCSLQSSAAGDVSLLASYSGDANYLSAVSAAYDHAITDIPTLAVTSFSPLSGQVGTSVTIYGRGFNESSPTSNAIYFNGVLAVASAASSIQLTTTVPTGASTGRIGVTVGALSALSNDSFTVIPAVERTAVVVITSAIPEPSTINQNFSIQVSVTAAETGGNTPTGTVTVNDGVTSCQIVLPATACSLSEGVVGQVTLTAAYSGDALFDPAVSPPFAHLTNPSDQTEICGFDPSAVPSDPPGFVQLNQASGAARTAGLVADIVGTGALSVSIASPLNGATTSEGSVDVTGTFSGPVDTGITVNGRLAYTYRGQFLVPQVPLNMGTNTLTVTATTLTGATASATSTITKSGDVPLLLIESDYPTGFAPTAVGFAYTLGMLPADATVQSAAIEYSEDGLYDYTSSELADLPTQVSYSKPGLHTLTIRVIDTNNVSYIAQRKVLIQDQAEQRGMICDIFAYLKDRLTASDATGASVAFQPAIRESYSSAFEQLGANMPNAVPYLGTIVDGQLGRGVAELELGRDNADQTRSGFPLRITQSADGVWRISEM